MNYTSNELFKPPFSTGLSHTQKALSSSAAKVAPRSACLTRRYVVDWLTPNFEHQSQNTIGPAIPIFEQAFNAFSRGSLVSTPNGPVAIEDLRPGMLIDVVGSDPKPLVWIGSITLIPESSHPDMPPSRLFRIADGNFGRSNGMPDLLLGSGARIMRTSAVDNPTARLQNIQDLCDGFSVVEVKPRSPAKVYHLGLASHSLIKVNGLIAETYHPGQNPQVNLSEEMFQVFLSNFPHIRNVDDFGPQNHLRAH